MSNFTRTPLTAFPDRHWVHSALTDDTHFGSTYRCSDCRLDGSLLVLLCDKCGQRRATHTIYEPIGPDRERHPFVVCGKGCTLKLASLGRLPPDFVPYVRELRQMLRSGEVVDYATEEQRIVRFCSGQPPNAEGESFRFYYIPSFWAAITQWRSFESSR